MATWPSGKRFTPLVGSLQESPANNIIRSTMDKGPEKVRRRTTANIRPISFTLLLSTADVVVMDDFFNNITYGGSDEFDYTHPRTKALVSARFKDAPSYQENGGVGLYKVQVSLEIMP